jgi:hypothetical protein
MLYNSCTGIYKFGNNTYPWRIRGRSNLCHIFGRKIGCLMGWEIRYFVSPSGLHIGPIYTSWFDCWKRTINHTTELDGCSKHNSPTCVVRYGILVGIPRNCFTARGQWDNHILSSISSPTFDCILLPWKIHLTFKWFPNEIKMHFISAEHKNVSPYLHILFNDI